MPLSQLQLDILSLLKKANHILLLPSSPLDGDSLGSSLALYLALKKLGKKVTVVAEEAIPGTYQFLPEASVIARDLNFVRDFIVTVDFRDAKPGTVRHEIQGNKVNIFVTPEKGTVSKENVTFSQGAAQYDCIVTVDAADPSQFGKIYDDFTELFHLVPVINIDHHASNSSFGKLNFVDIMASSTTMLILPLIEELGVTIDADIATLLLAGLITDTGSFQNANTTPDSFAIAAKLIGYGARQQEIIRHVYKTKKLSTLKLWGRTLSKIQSDEQHKLVWSVLTAKDFAELGSSPDETEGVIDELMSNAPGAEVIFLLKERGPSEVSGSIRTLTSTIDASALAGLFGGGGHVQAAGFKIHGKGIVEAEKSVSEAFKNFQKKRLRLPENDAPTPPTKVEAKMESPKPEVKSEPFLPLIVHQEVMKKPEAQITVQHNELMKTEKPVPETPKVPSPPTPASSEIPKATQKETSNMPFPPQPDMII